uniref:F-box protein At2g14710-like n=1 Tax=Erigeron canadensis TaxID=72917 RepID=UPI001CB90E92|nr:F-box protein At2g14710-like [Erigeron canadensis]
MRKRGMADNIPNFEMQVEIMKKLPVKSLAVFRSVSKAWKSMIDSPLFIKNYNLCPHHHFFIMCDVDTTEFKYVENDEFDNVCNVRVWFQRLERLKLVGTSNGLLCVSGYSFEDGCEKNKSVIWNPSLRKSIAVDVPYLYAVLGFGVRPDSFDPVIVMINNPVMV